MICNHSLIKASDIRQNDLIVGVFENSNNVMYNVFAFDFGKWTEFIFDKKIMSIGRGHNDRYAPQPLTKNEADIFCDLLIKSNGIRYEVKPIDPKDIFVGSFLYLFVKEVEEAEDDRIGILAMDNSKPSMCKKYTLSSNQDVFLVDRREMI
jgi:hypothetical protein